MRNEKGQFIKGHTSYRGGSVVRKCLVCKNEFKAKLANINRGKGKYCSQQCAWSYSHLKLKREDRNCVMCSKSFYPKSAPQVYCSIKCGNDSRVGKSVNAQHIITDEIREKQSRAQKLKYKQGFVVWNKGLKGFMRGDKSPNWGKIRLDMRGENNPNWKGGITNDTLSKRRNTEYYSWRLKVFNKDNYTCQICDQYNGYLHADHIKSWKDYLELRFDVNNGRTLCRACHYYVTFKRKMPEGSLWGIRIDKKVG